MCQVILPCQHLLVVVDNFCCTPCPGHHYQEEDNIGLQTPSKIPNESNIPSLKLFLHLDHSSELCNVIGYHYRVWLFCHQDKGMKLTFESFDLSKKDVVCLHHSWFLLAAWVQDTENYPWRYCLPCKLPSRKCYCHRGLDALFVVGLLVILDIGLRSRAAVVTCNMWVK